MNAPAPEPAQTPRSPFPGRLTTILAAAAVLGIAGGIIAWNVVTFPGNDRALKDETGKPFPQDPVKQLRGAIEAVFRSWMGARAIAYRVRERISHDLGTAVNVQCMVFGNRDDNSGTGVGFTRNAATGETSCRHELSPAIR